MSFSTANFHWPHLAFCLLLHGDLAEAETEFDGALAATRRAGDKSPELFCLVFLGWARLRQHDVAGTKALALESLKFSGAYPWPTSAMAKALLCWVAWKEGAPDEAERLGIEALQQWEPLMVRAPLCWICLLPLVAVRFAGERYHEAIEASTSPRRAASDASSLSTGDRLSQLYSSLGCRAAASGRPPLGPSVAVGRTAQLPLNSITRRNLSVEL